MNPVTLAILSLVTLAPAPAEATCLTKSQARAQWPTEHLSWRGRGRCWYVRGKDAGAAVVRRDAVKEETAPDQLHADPKPVKTFAFIVKPDEPAETAVQPVGLEDAPDSLTDDRPEALLMPTRDQWAPEDDHSEALWWVLGAFVLSVASAAIIASWPRRRARRAIL